MPMPMTSIRSLIQSVGSDERRSWFQELVNALSLQDRLELSALISKMNDPLERLPTEIVIQIFKFLPWFDAWRLQQICRSWQNVLSSPSLQRGLLARWETHPAVDTARLRGQPSQQSITDKLRHVQAWRMGLPQSKAEIPKSFASHEGWHNHGARNTQAQRTLALHGSRIAFLDSDSRLGDAVVVRDLTHDEADQRLQASARDKIMGIVLTDRYVAWVSFSARLYIQTLPVATGQMKTMYLPSASVTAFHADGSLIGLVVAQGYGDTSLLLLYSHVTGKLTHHTIDHPRPSSIEQEHPLMRSPENSASPSERDAADVYNLVWSAPSSMLLNERKGAIDLFYETTTRRQRRGRSLISIWLKHRRYHVKSGTLQEHKSESTVRIPALLDHGVSSVYRIDDVLARPSSTGIHDQWCFGTGVGDEGEETTSYFAPVFDAGTATLHVRQCILHGNLPVGSLERISLWKDTLQLLHPFGHLLTTLTVDGVALPPKTQSRYLARNHRVIAEDPSPILKEFVLNDSFMIEAAMADSGVPCGIIKIWCFETDLEWKMDKKTEHAEKGLNEMRICFRLDNLIK